MKTNYWKGKNVFITGVNGFVGGNLAKALVALGANIFGLIRDKTWDSFLFFEGINKKITLIEGDLIDKELLLRVLSEEDIQNVFHFGAQVEVGVARTNPYLTYETNVRGTYGLMEAVRLGAKSIQSIVIASTDKAYGSYPKAKMPYRENYPLIPQYPYDVSKACADMIARSYACDLYRLPVVVTRFCNIFGPGQLNFSALIPDATRSALGYSEFIPRGDGSQTRDFIFVEDVVALYLKLGEGLGKDPRRLSGEVFNAGTNRPASVRQVLRAVYAAAGNKKGFLKVEKRFKGRRTAGEIDCQYMDYKKAHRFFGWKPKRSFEDGLSETVEWYGRYLKSKH